MAIGRLSVTAGHAGEANSWYDYVMREGIHAPEKGDTERVILKESGNMPDWAKDDPKFFWEMADDKEPYANGTTYRQHIVTLPRGLSDEQLIELAQRHIEQHNKGRFAYTMAIHCPTGLDGKEQPHLHYMFNEKIIDGIERGADTYFKRYNSKNPERGGGKKDNTGLTHQERDVQLQEVRNQWEVTCNEYLAEIGHPERIDMRNWKERGETQAPVNISMKAMFNAEVKQAYIDKLNANAMLETAQADISMIDLETELATAKDRLAREIAKFEHHQGIQTRLSNLATYDNAQLTQAELRQFDKATYETIVNYEPVALDKINDIITKVKMGEPLSKQNETDYRYAKAFLSHTQAMRIDGSLEQLRQSELAPPPIPTPAPIAPPEPIAPVIEPVAQPQPAPIPAPIALAVKIIDEMLSEYETKRQAGAKKLLNAELVALQEEGKPLLDEYNELSKKQSVWGKVSNAFDDLSSIYSRKERAEQALTAYNEIKDSHDKLQKKGVTDEFLKSADSELMLSEPELYKAVNDYNAEQQSQAQSERDRLALEKEQRIKAERDRQAKAHADKVNSLGVDKKAVNGERYWGVITAVTDVGIIQKVGDSLVLHDRLKDKDYNAGQIWELDYSDTATTGQVMTRRDEQAERYAQKQKQVTKGMDYGG